MRRHGLVFAATFLMFWALAARAERPQKLVRVRVESVQSTAVQNFLRTGPDVAGYDPRTKTLIVLARPRDLRKLDELGLRYEVEIESLAQAEQWMRTSGYFDHFHDYERCKQELEWAETNFPDLAKVYDIGDGWEKTQGIADRDILAIKISDNVAEQEEEPEVLILSNHHAREIITPEIAVYMIHYLLENYGKDPYVTYLVDHRQIWIIPTMNPDGLDFVFTQNRWWRKNRRDNGDGSFGVDLNRNYAYKWGYNDVGSSSDPSSNIYRGTGPFSEPETQAIRDLCIAHHFKIILSYHSYSQLYLYPWGYVARNTPDNYVFVALADSMAHYNGYLPGNVASGAIYLTNGDSDDWFYGEQEVKNKIFGLTVEVGTSFFPDTTEIMPQILENLQPNLFAIWAVGEEPVVDVPRVPDTENAVGPYTVKARIRPAITLTDTCILDPSSFFLHYSFDGASWDSVQMTVTGSPDVYAGPIPGRGTFGPVYFYVTAWSVDGRRGAWPRPAPAAVDSFLVTKDEVAPTIVHTPLPDQSVYKGAYEVDVALLDDAGIDSAWLEYWTDGPVFSTDLEPRDSLFVGQIVLNPPVPGVTVHYRIFARDASSNRNVAVAPEQGAYSFRILDYQVCDLESDSVLIPVSGTDWQWGRPTSGPRCAHSGLKVWATNLSGKYSDNADDRLNTPPIDLRGAEHPIFQFWHWYDFEYSGGRLWDGGNLKISVDGGPFELLTTVVGGYDHVVDAYNRVLGGEQAFGGPPGTGDFWHPTYVDLTPYVGHTVVIQFHFASDAHATEEGWYIDDVGWKVFRKGTPEVAALRVPRNTSDTSGPYAVLAQAWDDTAVVAVKLYYTVGADSGEVDMVSAGDSLYSGTIPGQPLGSVVRFYVEAVDNSGNVGRDPVGAPAVAYRFEVTDSRPSARVSPAAFEFRLRADSSTTDTLWVENRGKIDLNVRVTVGDGDRTVQRAVPRADVALPEGLFKLEKASADWERARWRKGRLPAVAEAADLACSQRPVSVLKRDVFSILRFRSADGCAELVPWPDGGTYLLWLARERNEAGLFDAATGHLIVAVPLSRTEDGWAVVVPNAVFRGNWQKLTLRLWQKEGTEWFCTAAGVFGPDPLAWLRVEPDSVLVPGEARYPLRVEVSTAGLAAGTYQTSLVLRSNDPEQPSLEVPVRLTVEPTTRVAEDGAGVPSSFSLSPAYPNPFNPGTVFRYSVPRTGEVRLEVFNSRGERVCTLVNGKRSPGVYVARWDGRDQRGQPVAAGVYVCRLTVTSGGATVWQGVQKALLLR